ncbi:hypothetical protein DFH29DRAFT_802801, partial [Suillus ampliporus]
LLMHPCLQIHEVLRNIFSALNKYRDITLDAQKSSRANYGIDVRRQTLARLARTCRTFSEPALDVLWAHIDTLSPLVACLPKYVWSRHRHSLVSPRCSMVAPCLTWHAEDRWLYFDRTLGEPREGDVSPELAHALCGHPWPLLLPRLEKLFWSDGSYESTHLLCNLLSPTLTELHLHAKGSLFMLSVLSNLGVTCPFMKDFSTTGLDSAASVPVSAAVVCGWRQLKTLSTEVVDGSALSHLSTLPSLEHLEFSFLSLNNGFFKYSPTTFSTPLQHLTIRTESSELCMPFLKATWISARNIFIYLGNAQLRSSSNETLLSLLASRVTAQQVQAFSFEMACNSLLTFTEIMPLSSFCMLKELNLSTFSINDEDLITVVKSWPKLTKLRLGDEGTWAIPARPQTTLDGIAGLLLHCPDLCVLGIVMDATSYSAVTPEVPGGGVTNTKITTLSVGASLIENPLAVVAFLSCILPNLKDILYKVDTQPPHHTDRREKPHTKWARAATYLPDVQMIRRQERALVENERLSSFI